MPVTQWGIIIPEKDQPVPNGPALSNQDRALGLSMDAAIGTAVGAAVMEANSYTDERESAVRSYAAGKANEARDDAVEEAKDYTDERVSAVADLPPELVSALQAWDGETDVADPSFAAILGDDESASRAELDEHYAGAAFFKRQPAGEGAATSGDRITIGRYNAIADDLGTAAILAGGTTNYENVIGADTTDNVNTSTSNLPTAPGTGADWSVIIAGYDNVVNGSACVVAGYHNKVESGSTHCTIAGGSIHAIPTGVDYSTISGGTQNTVTGDHASVGGGVFNEAANRGTVGGGYANKATGDNATVAGGNNNDATATGSSVGGGTNCDATGDYSHVGGGQNNAASGASAMIGGGSSNTASGQWASIIGGTGNTASATAALIMGGSTNVAQGQYSAVLGGQQNTAEADYSTASGRGAVARFQHSTAHAAGTFSASGDAQVIRAISRREVPGGTLTELYLSGGATRLVLPDDTTWAFTMTVAARATATSESAAYRVTGCIDRGTGAGSTALVGAPTVTPLGEDVPDWDFQVDADTTNGSLRLRVLGEAGKPIRWVVLTEIVSVTG